MNGDIILGESLSDQAKDVIKVASGIGCGILLYIAGGKLGKLAR